jgi:REP element-mobilizing transposase RayT
MPYRKVHFAQGHYYHVYNRGIDRRPIFREAANYTFLLRRLKEYADALQIAVIAYCLMLNHYHLLLRQDGEAPVGLLMQRVFNSYTKAYNKRYGRQGTLFGGRYRAIHVDREPYLRHVCRYIHANPVKHGFVEQVALWPYSNYPEWVGAREGSLVDRPFVEGLFATGAAYAAFVQDYVEGLSDLPRGTRAYLID